MVLVMVMVMAMVMAMSMVMVVGGGLVMGRVMAIAVESISRKDPHKLPSNFFSFKSLYHPGMCLGTTRDHSRAPGAPGGHSKCTFFAFFGPGRAIIRSRAAKTLDSNSDTTAHRTSFCFLGTWLIVTFPDLFGLAGLQTDDF